MNLKNEGFELGKLRYGLRENDRATEVRFKALCARIEARSTNDLEGDVNEALYLKEKYGYSLTPGAAKVILERRDSLENEDSSNLGYQSDQKTTTADAEDAAIKIRANSGVELGKDRYGSLDNFIRKIGEKEYRVYSESGKNMGTYGSEAAAKKRLGQIEFFKRKGK